MSSRFLPALAALAFVACSGGETSETPPAPTGPAELVITARDFTFELPDTIMAGLTRIRLVNEGPALHHAQLLKFNEGKSLADLEAAMKAGPGPTPSWLEEVGGPNPPEPGMETNTTQNLEPGNYAVVCFVDLPDKVPHIMKGMAKPFVVVTPAAAAAPAPEPVPTVTMTLADYAFQLSAPLTAGKHTVRIDNAGPQTHEVAILKLKPGKTMEDFQKWGETYQGEQPVTILGGIAGIKTGGRAWFDVDLTAGDYILICFVSDAKDQKPHFMHGMVQQFTIS
jgi:hypothetical protein